MVRKKQYERPPSKALTTDGLTTGIRGLNRRIDELKAFDIDTISEHFDPKVVAMEKKINSTIADIFDRDSPEYRDYEIISLNRLPLRMAGPDHSIQSIRGAYEKGISNAVTKLTSLRETLEEKLEDLDSSQASRSVLRDSKAPPGNGKIFVVHGHDELAKETVARFISKLDLEPVILHEEPNTGRTIAEKLEAHTQVDFAVVLLTPDDVGHALGCETEAKPRARQNVILELGLFLGVLGRERVCAMLKGDIEFPSDYDGVLYIEMDEEGAWKFKLAREMKAAGIDVDLNRVT